MHVVLLPPRGPLAFTGGKNTPPLPRLSCSILEIQWKFNKTFGVKRGRQTPLELLRETCK